MHEAAVKEGWGWVGGGGGERHVGGGVEGMAVNQCGNASVALVVTGGKRRQRPHDLLRPRAEGSRP